MSRQEKVLQALGGLLEREERADYVDVRKLIAAVRVRRREVVDLLFENGWLRPLLFRHAYSDVFLQGLLDIGSAHVPCAQLAHLWSSCRPQGFVHDPADTNYFLRKTFKALCAFEKKRGGGGGGGGGGEGEGVEPGIRDTPSASAPTISPRSVHRAFVERVDFRALASSEPWFQTLLELGIFVDLHKIVREPLDLPDFTELATSLAPLGVQLMASLPSIQTALIESILPGPDQLHAEWPIPPYRYVTHLQVRQLATAWGIDPRSEPHLLWVVRQALATPLPAEWEVTEVDKERGAASFRHVVQEREAATHPATDYFRRLVEHEREQHKQHSELGGIDADLDPCRAWMQFTVPVSERDYVAAGEAAAAAAAVSEAKEPDEEWADGRVEGKDDDDQDDAAESVAIELKEEKEGFGVQLLTYFFNFAKATAQGVPPAPEEGYILADDSGHTGSAVALAFPIRENPNLGTLRSLRKAHARKNVKPSDVTTLNFQSWWNDHCSSQDGPVKRHVDLYFHIGSGNVQAFIHGTDKVFTFSHLPGRDGPLEAWDLCIGAKINLLGRRMTLMQGSLQTIRWNEHHYARFAKVRDRLYAELLKYERPKHSGAAPLAKLRIRSATKVSHGRANLRAYRQDIQLLKECLEQYRPKLAARLALEGLNQMC